MDDAALVAAARDATADAYTPYSEYRVGAALLTADGETVTGFNMEVSNYSNSIHAEEVALVRAYAEGHRDFEAVAVSSDARDGLTPCGMCRQTLSEFCDDSLVVLADAGDGTDRYTLGELLPAAMSGDTLDAA